MTVPLVTTVIPVFNRDQLLRSAVDSVLAQDYPEIELILVDDGSSDSFARQYRDWAAADARIKVIHQSNQGPGPARQTGLDHAAGQYIQFLDSDDLIAPNKFSAQVAVMEQNRDAHASYGKSLEVQASHFSQTDFAALDESEYLPMRGTGSARSKLFPRLLNERWWTTSSPLYRASVLRGIGPWLALINEEDWEYDARLAALGGELVYIEQWVSARLLHDDHLSLGGTTSPEKLSDRVIAKHSIYESARRYERLGFSPKISDADWREFSRYSFLLARQCAAAGLTKEYQELYSLSIQAAGSESWGHRIFKLVHRVFGGSGATQIFKAIGK